MQLSTYQNQILDWVEAQFNALTKNGLIIKALAGTGKSTMLCLICELLKKNNFYPNQVACLVFGKKNKKDLKDKISKKLGENWSNSVKTLHSLAYRIYINSLGIPYERVKMDDRKYKQIAETLGLFPIIKDGEIIQEGILMEEENPAIYSEKEFLKLIDLLRLYALDVTKNEVNRLVHNHKIGINLKHLGLVTSSAKSCLDKGLSEGLTDYKIDFTDQIWIPWRMRYESRFNAAFKQISEQLKVIMLDEAQDTDLLQIEILKRIVNPQQSYLIAVGDENQAVYYFRGCLSNGLDTIKNTFNCETLPLPICYRCGTEHLNMVRKIYPIIPIQPRNDAPKGEIRVINYPDLDKIFYDKTLTYIGLCRKNAPLVSTAISLLSKGIPAEIKDKKLGNKLVEKVKDICRKQKVKYDVDTFIENLSDYRSSTIKILNDFPNSDNLIADLEDYVEAISALFIYYTPIDYNAWQRIVDKIFNESGYSPFSLYTIHSAKGGEAEVSFIIYPEEMPLEHPNQVKEEKRQEHNLIYVALTRALANGKPNSGILYLVKRDETKTLPMWVGEKYCKLWKWHENNNNWCESKTPELLPEIKPEYKPQDKLKDKPQDKPQDNLSASNNDPQSAQITHINGELVPISRLQKLELEVLQLRERIGKLSGK